MRISRWLMWSHSLMRRNCKKEKRSLKDLTTFAASCLRCPSPRLGKGREALKSSANGAPYWQVQSSWPLSLRITTRHQPRCQDKEPSRRDPEASRIGRALRASLTFLTYPFQLNVYLMLAFEYSWHFSIYLFVFYSSTRPEVHTQCQVAYPFQNLVKTAQNAFAHNFKWPSVDPWAPQVKNPRTQCCICVMGTDPLHTSMSLLRDSRWGE